jgi:hypothetical protein
MFNEKFKDEDWQRMTDTILRIMGTQIVKIDSVGFNNAIIRCLDALKGDTRLKPNPEYKLTFRKGGAAAFDAYRYPGIVSGLATHCKVF